MPDIYGKETKFNGSHLVTADEMILTIADKESVETGGSGKEEYLVQNVTIQYNQPLNRIYEVGSNYVYFAPGRPMGSIQIGRLIGRKSIEDVLGTTGSGVWTTGDFDGSGEVSSHAATFTRKINPQGNGFKNVVGNALNITYRIGGLVIESYGVTVDANGMVTQENVSGQFASLNMNYTAGGVR